MGNSNKEQVEKAYLKGYTEAMELMTDQIADQSEQAATALRALKKDK